MQFLVYFLYALELVLCLLLAVVILLQKPKEGGLGVSFGGGMGEALFGAQMGNVLTKTTVILGAAFLLNTLILSGLTSRAIDSRMERVRSAPAAPVTMPETLPMPMSEGVTPEAAAPVAVPAAPAAPADAPVAVDVAAPVPVAE